MAMMVWGKFEFQNKVENSKTKGCVSRALVLLRSIFKGHRAEQLVCGLSLGDWRRIDSRVDQELVSHTQSSASISH